MILECRDLRFVYPTGFVAGPLTVALPAGVYHLVGRNGSGKTTLMRCLCGGLRGSSGTVSVVGRDPRTDVEARRQIAFAPSEADLPDFLTVDEAWGELAALRGVPTWDGRALCARFSLPGTLRLEHASAGQRRAAELIASLAGDPRVLLLDEPFANLDPRAVDTLVALLDERRARACIVLTCHDALPIRVDGEIRIGSPESP